MKMHKVGETDVKYVFRSPLTIKHADDADPQKVGETLDEIRIKNNGRLTPEAVVTAAENNRSSLHRYFEWDDSKAAHAYRIDQARELIRAIRVIVDDRDEPVQAFMSLKDKDGTAYHSVEDVCGCSQLQLIVLRQAQRDLEAWENRYQEIEDICDLVRAARTKLADRREMLEKKNENRPTA